MQTASNPSLQPPVCGTRRFVLAGTHSGAGKTTTAIGLMAAFARRGLHIQPYKCGPDYLDPTWHTAVTGTPSRNLDLWMLSKATVKRLAARPADLSIVEGVMGLFDGPGSTAELARLLRAPVVLVVDAGGMSGSVAAIVRGFETLERGVRLAGVILNRVSGDGHYQLLRESIERHCRATVLGYLPKDDQLHMPERHLGLVPAQQTGRINELADRLVQHLERNVNLDSLLAIAATAAPLGDYAPAARATEPAVRIAVARDEAFCFYYEDNLDLLRACGAELVFFSPLAGDELPADVGAVYFGGGFPELFAEQLQAGPPAEALRRLPIYAECGGLMYLAMLGLIPGRVTMTDRLQNFGYCEAAGINPALMESTAADAAMAGPAPTGSWLLRAGETIRGHEFHYSRWEGEGIAPACMARRRRTGSQRPEGYADARIHASYVHVHFHGCPWFARRFVRIAARHAKEARDGVCPSNATRGRGLSDAAAVRAGGEPRRDRPAGALLGG